MSLGPDTRQLLARQPLDEVADEAARQPNSVQSNAAEVEMRRRVAASQIEAAEGQKLATKAQIKAAEHAERSATYMKWSVYVLAAGSLLTAAATWFHK
jgi:hypothetical protein